MHNDSVAFYRIAEITIAVHSDLPVTETTFSPKLVPFRTTGLGVDNIIVHHHFGIPVDADQLKGTILYQQLPWCTVTADVHSCVYDYHSTNTPDSSRVHLLHAVWNATHTQGKFYHAFDAGWLAGGVEDLTLGTTDQLLLARVLADRQGCLIHSAGMIVDKKGYLFIGPSGAGKSTTINMLRPYGEILCEDRMVVRNYAQRYRIYGTWCHGDLSNISTASAPLHALCFIEQSDSNKAIRLTDPRDILSRLLPRLVKPLITVDWWEKTLATVENLIHEVPAYRLLRDRSGQIIDVIRNL